MGKGGLVAYNQKDFWSLMFKIRGSIFDNVLPKLILTNVLCVVASVVQMASTDLLHSDGNNINNLAFTLAGSSISFLLVFRSQMSYNRFWEGRGHLGNIMFAGRDLARQISTCVQNDEGKSGAPSSMQAEQEKSWHVNGKPVQMGEYRQDAGVRAEFTKMTGFRRLQMLRILLIFWRLMVQHARDMKEPEFVGKLVLLKGEESNPDKVRYLTTPHLEYFLKAKARRPLCAVAILTRYIHQEYEEKNITNMEYRVRPHSHTRTPHTRARPAELMRDPSVRGGRSLTVLCMCGPCVSQLMNKNLNMLIQGFNGVDKVHTVQIPFPYAQVCLADAPRCASPGCPRCARLRAPGATSSSWYEVLAVGNCARAAPWRMYRPAEGWPRPLRR